jgi:hypothetical protein
MLSYLIFIKRSFEFKILKSVILNNNFKIYDFKNAGTRLVKL